jgi:mRNA interferase MazF
MRRGEIRWYTFQPPDKRRPALILTRNSIIPYLTSLTVAPITTTIREIPSEVVLTPGEDKVLELCVVNLDNIQTVPKSRISLLLTTLSPERMAEVSDAITFALELTRFSGLTSGSSEEP